MGCPVPHCERGVPKRSVFCVEHYFMLPRAYTSLVFRTKFACERADDDSDRLHLREQFDGYVSACVRKIQQQGNRV